MQELNLIPNPIVIVSFSLIGRWGVGGEGLRRKRIRLLTEKDLVLDKRKSA